MNSLDFKTIITTTQLPPEEDLQKDPQTKFDLCLERFCSKGGVVEMISSVQEAKPLKILRGAAIYPVCSGGSFRSQAVWAHLKKYEQKIVLFRPHSANHGYDPYNGRTNRDRSHARDESLDEFEKHFGMKKSPRAGFENEPEWQKIAANPTEEGLHSIQSYYNRHYFGPCKEATKRIYIVFEKNVHIVLHRLALANDHLEGVTLLAINMKDIISKPPAHLNCAPRTACAYAHFEEQLKKLLDLSELNA